MASASPTSLSGFRNRKKGNNPNVKFQFELNCCSKKKDLKSAISLYENALSKGLQLNQTHFNSLLYLCASSVTDPSLSNLSFDFGHRVYDRMVSMGINPNEAAITSVARLAAAKGDGNYAFELVKSMGKYDIVPKLRTYDPALFCFCEKLDADKAYEVEEHMSTVGLSLEEDELAALMKVSTETGREQKVYAYLRKMRITVRRVSDKTAKIIENWFACDNAFEVGGENLDIVKVKEAILRNPRLP